MHLNKVYRRKKTLNNTELILVLLLSLFEVTNGETIYTWYGSNLTVTRNVDSSDYFDIWNDINTKECSLLILPNVCKSYGAIGTKTKCKMSCCKRCICDGKDSTYSVHKQKCVRDNDVSRLQSGPNQFLFDSSSSSSVCSNNNNKLPTLNLDGTGTKTFSICSNGDEVPDDVDECSLVPGNHTTVDSWDGMGDSPIDVGNVTFKVNKKLEFMWSSGGLRSLRGKILSLAVQCTTLLNVGLTTQKNVISSRLYFKIAGSQTSRGPQIFYTVYQPNFRTTAATTRTVTTTTGYTTTTTEYQSKMNVVQVPGKVDMLLVIVAAVLGSLLFLVIAVAILMIVVFRRKQKLNISGKHTSNPTYERGPDQSFTPNGHNTSSFKSHFYQPLVENSRFSPSREPIYESLDDNLRDQKMTLTENPNRCSLAYCDVTGDGYLIPTDGPAPPPPARINTQRYSPVPEHTTRPRLSSSYDEPEVILKDRKPKVSLPAEEKAKPFYYELEENNEIQRDQKDNEIVADNCPKSPTENTYLELIAEEKRRPLESEIL